MTEVYLGEIRLFSWTRDTRDWTPCDGRMLSVPQNQALYSLLGHRFGGDGKKTFALPDLRGRVIVGAAAGGHPVAGEYATGPEPRDQTPDAKRPFLTLQYCIATRGDYPPRPS